MKMNPRPFLVLDTVDNVATAISDISAGVELHTDWGEVQILNDIEFGHKFAVQDIPKDSYVIKYGVKIGRASRDIKQGEHVHVHNVADIVNEIRAGNVR